MSEESYDKAKVDGIIENFLDNQEEALVQLKASHDKIANLESELKKAEEEKVYLQKVASEAGNKAPFSEVQLQETLQVLVDGSYLDPSQMEKFASDLQENPDKVLATLDRVVEFSLTSHSEGQGIHKIASSDDADLAAENAAWGRCLNEGA
jgi:hypothetical protein